MINVQRYPIDLLNSEPVIFCYAGKEFLFSNITACSKQLGISRQTISKRMSKPSKKDKFFSFKSFRQDGSFNKMYYSPEDLNELLNPSKETTINFGWDENHENTSLLQHE